MIRADLHGASGAVGEAPDGVVGAVGVLEGGGERDPAREVTVSGDGEGPLERADACHINKIIPSWTKNTINHPETSCVCVSSFHYYIVMIASCPFRYTFKLGALARVSHTRQDEGQHGQQFLIYFRIHTAQKCYFYDTGRTSSHAFVLGDERVPWVVPG